jgi:hypothetical protein
MRPTVLDPIAGMLGGGAATCVELIPGLRADDRISADRILIAMVVGMGSGAVHAALSRRGRNSPPVAAVLTISAASWAATTLHHLIVGADPRLPRADIGQILAHLVSGSIIYGALRVADEHSSPAGLSARPGRAADDRAT